MEKCLKWILKCHFYNQYYFIASIDSKWLNGVTCMENFWNANTQKWHLNVILYSISTWIMQIYSYQLNTSLFLANKMNEREKRVKVNTKYYGNGWMWWFIGQFNIEAHKIETNGKHFRYLFRFVSVFLLPCLSPSHRLRGYLTWRT